MVVMITAAFHSLGDVCLNIAIKNLAHETTKFAPSVKRLDGKVSGCRRLFDDGEPQVS